MAKWMIEYQDHITFVNLGDEDRTITLHLRNHGASAILFRDSVTGKVRTPPKPLGCEKRAVYQQLQVSTHRVCIQSNAGDARLSVGSLLLRHYDPRGRDEIGQ
jgi:hypothetical protein